MAGPNQYGGRRPNIWAALRNLADAQMLDLTTSGVPTSGTTGTFAGKAAPGAEITDTATGNVYRNVGTQASPIWLITNSPVIANGGLGLLGNAKMTYDFAVDGGAIGLITPANSPTIPIKAIILGGTVDVTTTLTSGGAATIALGLGSGAQVAALKAATAVASYAAGQVALTPVFTAATYVKAAAAARLTLSVATAALTAGRMDVNLVYLVGN
jgi:hypothetical protein